MALLQPGDLFPNGTASIAFTSGSGITITPFSQSGNAYVFFETDLISNPNTTQYLQRATFTEKTNSLGEVVDGSGYRAGIVTHPSSSFVFTPSVDIPEGRVLIKSTGNIGLDIVLTQTTAFIARVEADGGTVENSSCGDNRVKYLLNNP